jgi:hypothetical protein
LTGSEWICETNSASFADRRRRRTHGRHPTHPDRQKGLTVMKTAVTLIATASLLALAACGGGTPPTKPVERNTQTAPAGSMKSSTEAMKEAMGSSQDASADSKKK